MKKETKEKIDNLLKILFRESLDNIQQSQLLAASLLSFICVYKPEAIKSSRIKPVTIALQKYIQANTHLKGKTEARDVLTVFGDLMSHIKNKESIVRSGANDIVAFLEKNYTHNEYSFTSSKKIMALLKSNNIEISAVMLGKYMDGLGWEKRLQNNVRGWAIYKLK